MENGCFNVNLSESVSAMFKCCKERVMDRMRLYSCVLGFGTKEERRQRELGGRRKRPEGKYGGRGGKKK